MKTQDDIAPKIAFIGCGHIAHIHIHFLKKLGISVNAVCDFSITRAEIFADKYSIPNFYQSFSDLVEKEHPGIIHVLTPPHTHYDIIMQGLENGCHVFVEKPLCQSSIQVDALFKKATDVGRSLCVDHTRVYNPMVLKALDLIKSGKYGKVVRIEYDYDDPCLDTTNKFNSNFIKGTPLWIRKLKGGMVEDLLPHPISVMLSIDPELRMKNISSRVNRKGIIEDLIAQLSSEQTDALIKLSLKIKPLRNNLTILCRDGMIKIDLRNMYSIFLPNRKIPNILARVINTISEVSQMALGFTISIFNIITGRIHPYSGLDKIYEKFYAQVLNNKIEEVPLINAEKVVGISEQILDEAMKGFEEEHKYSSTLKEEVSDRLNIKADYLVTGGTGFIGSVLVKQIHKKGHKVRVFCRPDSNLINLPNEIGVAFGDMRDKSSLVKSLKGITTVYHCASAMGGDWADYHESTVLGTKNLLEALKKSDVKTFVYLSSLGILNYNKLSNNDTVNESSPLEDNLEARGFYTRAKKESEDLVQQFAKENKNIKTIIIRPGLVYGKESNKNLENSGVLLDRFLFVFGLGRRFLGLNYVGNLSDLLIKAAASECDSVSVIHSVDYDQPTVSEYIKKHNDFSENKVFPIYIPIFIWKAVFICVDYLLLIKNRAKGTFTYKFASNSKTLTYNSDYCEHTLDWAPPYSFNDAMSHTFKRK